MAGRMTKKQFEERKIRLVMKVKNMTRAEAVRFVRRSNAKPEEHEAPRRRVSGARPTRDISGGCKFMPAEEFFKMAEEEG